MCVSLSPNRIAEIVGDVKAAGEFSDTELKDQPNFR